MTDLLGNRYRIEKVIGRGGMATVYLAYDTILNREVAIKVLKEEMCSDPVALERFAREARASARLTHPNIVEIYDVGDEENLHYIVMEYIKGYTLKKLLEVRGAIPCKESVWMVKQLSLALLEAHKNGIIHRDVKSQNVLIKSDGTVKMADFGIAQANDDLQITHHDTILGSVHYLAPELTKGRAASMQSDIYSLGIVFYELLVGDVPFKGDSAVSVALKHVNSRIPSVRKIHPEIPQSVENIIIKATAKNPRNRYENIAILLKDLNDCLKEEHLHDRKLVLEEPEGTETIEIVDVLKEKQYDGQKKGLFSKGLGIFALSLLSVVCIGAFIAVLFLSGVLSFNTESKETTVPDILECTLTDAQDLLDEASLSIDYANIERVLTDDTAADIILSSDPEPGEKVSKYTKVKLVISDGIYSKMESYVGLSVEEVKNLLSGTNIKATYNYVDSQSSPGTIISQSIEKGEKYDASSLTEISFEVSRYVTISINNVRGRKVEEVKKEFEEQGATVEIIEKEKSEFQEELTERYEAETVVVVEPGEGSTYTIDETKPIKLYYYKEGEKE